MGDHEDIDGGGPDVLAVRNPYVRSGESSELLVGVGRLSDMLTIAFSDDAHFAAYEASTRLKHTALANNGRVMMQLLVFDVDCAASHKAGGGSAAHPAPNDWFEKERHKLTKLLKRHPAAFIYRTRGGYRIVYKLRSPHVVTEETKRLWSTFYVRCCAYLARSFDIVCDCMCSDWTRLFRVPHATREVGGAPEQRETLGDPASVGVWTHVPGCTTEEICEDLGTAVNLGQYLPAWKGHGSKAIYRSPETVKPQTKTVRADLRDVDPIVEQRDWPTPDTRAARAAKYVSKIPPAISGQGGHSQTWAVAIVLVRGFALPLALAWEIFVAYNDRCSPPWSSHELQHKLESAATSADVPVGYILRTGGAPSATDPLCGLKHLSKVAIVGRDVLLSLAADPVSFVWQDIAVGGTIVLLAGGPGEGKTTLLFLVLAARLTRGAPVVVLGRRVSPIPANKFVVLIEGEHSERSTARKLERAMCLLGVDNAALDHIIVVARKAVTLGSPEWEDVTRLVAAGLVSDIALDTIARIMPADANAEKEQVQIFDKIAQTIEAAPNDLSKPTVWVVAHTRKNVTTGDVSDVSGSVQRSGQADTVLIVKGARDAAQRIVSSRVTFAKLREEPDEYPVPVEFAIVHGPGGARIDTRVEHVKRHLPLEAQIIEELRRDAKTEKALRDCLRRNGGDIRAALDELVAKGHVKVACVKQTNGRTYKGFALCETPNEVRVAGT